MALLTISGHPASRWEEVAQAVSQLARLELVTESRLDQWIAEEFGDATIPGAAWRPAAVSILARMATEHHLVVALPGSELLFPPQSLILRAGVIAPEPYRVGNIMLDQRVGKPEAQRLLAEMDAEARRRRKVRFGRSNAPAEAFDLLLNVEHFDAPRMAEVLRAAIAARGLAEQGLLSPGVAAEMQFKTRLELARHRIVPAGHANLRRAAFGHPSEEMFANLLDFYRIQWEYEPRAFPLQWDKDGKVTEAFTPDFYLPEFDLYVELTTMRQSLVTRKNHKVKLLRAIYPHINIQVFYQKDFQALVFKYGLRVQTP